MRETESAKLDVANATGAQLIDAVDPENVRPMRRPHEVEADAQARALDKCAPSVGALIDGALALLRARASGAARPIPLPWGDLAEALGGGLWPGLHVLTGGTGTGKTQLALQAALVAATAGTPTLYVGLELGEPDLVARLLALRMAEIDGAQAPKWSDLYL